MTWKKGSMTFTNAYAKPPHTTFDEWLKSDSSRKWVSKKGENCSKFIARIVRDLERSGAQVKSCLIEDLGRRTEEMKHYIDLIDEEDMATTHHPVTKEVFHAIKTLLDRDASLRAKAVREGEE